LRCSSRRDGSDGVVALAAWVGGRNVNHSKAAAGSPAASDRAMVSRRSTARPVPGKSNAFCQEPVV
jgi:hypothetical protein